MKLLGLFVTVNGKDVALASFDRLIRKYNYKRPMNDHHGVSICKEYCHDVISLINECLAAEMWGPQRCIKRLKEYQGNDDVNKAQMIMFDVYNIVTGLRSIIETSIPIKDLPSCKRLTELTVSDAISASKDLVKSNILRNAITIALLVKDGCDCVKISNVEDFYKTEIKQLQKEVCELGREMSPVEIFLMTKYKAELAYCYEATVKTGLSIAKEVMDLIGDVKKAISDYEGGFRQEGGFVMNNK